MRNFVKRLHSIQVLLALALPFILMFPLFFIFLQRKSWYDHAYVIHHWWSKIFFFLSGLSYQIEYRAELDPNRAYIFCPNHFSYLDIPAMVRNRFLFVFMGKNSMEKIPLFGFMYKRMHITLDRQNLKSAYRALTQAGEVISEGKSLTIFPEGGIITPEAPNLVRFKDGAFRLAIEKKVPIVPVTLPYNWIILPDDGKLLVNRGDKIVKMIFHEPIQTNSMTIKDIDLLREKTYSIIDKELKIQNGLA